MIKCLTKGYTKVPLLRIDFNLVKYRKHGAKNSCNVLLHPTLKADIKAREDIHDTILRDKINDVIDYIRDNYDMEELTK